MVIYFTSKTNNYKYFFMTYFLIPSYNEAENLFKLVTNITQSLYGKKTVIIIDDGSTDKTVQIIKKLARKYPVRRIGYRQNAGAGNAFKHGFNYLIPKLKNNDLVVTMEADNTTDYQVLNKMIDFAKINDLVLASPHAKDGAFLGVSYFRIVLSRISSFCDSLIFSIKGVKTYSSFYRVYTAQILKKLQEVYGSDLITQNGFSAGVEILVKADRIGAKKVEIPATVDWRKRIGKSKMNIFKNTLGHFLLYRDYFLGKF